MNDNEDIARLLHEAIEQLGRKGSAAEIADLVKRLDVGLPIEDELMVLCAWLGQCRLIHKLDQQQMPAGSAEEFQVPDVLATFTVEGKPVTVLIEVKSSTKNVLSFRPAYLRRLQAYAEMLRLPLLIAWKWHSVWCLFEPRHCKRIDKNFSVNWKTALTESLLGLLAGDFSYSLQAGVGLHVHCRKVNRFSVERTGERLTEGWDAVIDEAYFTGGKGERIREVPAGVQSMLMIGDFEQQDEISETHIVQHFMADEKMALFARGALVRLLDFRTPEGQRVHWRSHVKDEDG